MRHLLYIALAAVLAVVLAVAGVQASTGAVLWFSSRAYIKGGHPLRYAATGAPAPGPIVMWFVQDNWNPKTCLAMIRDFAEAKTYVAPADPASCALPDGP